MGNTFIRLKFFKFLLYPFFRLSASISDKIHTQNIYDALLYHSFGAKLSDIFLFESPGIDPASFPARSFSKPNNSPLNVLFVGRLLWQKGLRDFLNLLKHTDILSSEKFSFTIVGSLDPNHPDRLHQQDIVDLRILVLIGFHGLMILALFIGAMTCFCLCQSVRVDPELSLKPLFQVFPLSLRKYLVFLTWSLIASLGFW